MKHGNKILSSLQHISYFVVGVFCFSRNYACLLGSVEALFNNILHYISYLNITIMLEFKLNKTGILPTGCPK